MERKVDGLNHTGLEAVHFQETVRFYQEGLGAAIKYRWGKEQEILMMDVGRGTCVEIFDCSGQDRKDSGRGLHMGFFSDNVKESFARAVKAGAIPVKEPSLCDILEAWPHPVFMWHATVRGLEGEKIEFIQEVADSEG